MIISNRRIVKIHTPLTRKTLSALRAGDEVLLSGEILTARDQAHRRLVKILSSRGPLPLDLGGRVIYYCGPARKPKGKVIGSCGPTTSARMDPFTEPLLNAGLAAVIGKGRRSQKVRGLLRKKGCVYFLAAGGAGAFLSKRVVSAKVVLYKDLGPEAVTRLRVRDFPLIVGIDTKGRDVFQS